MDIQYYLNGEDITNTVTSSNVELRDERKIIGSDTLTIADYTLTIIDDFNLFKLNSPFYELVDDVNDMIVQSTTLNNVRFLGYIKNLTYNQNKETILTVQPFISKEMLSIVNAYVSDNETPASALMKLLEWLGLAEYIDYSSFHSSSAIQASNGLYVNITISDNDNIQLQNIINSIADISCADIYIDHLGMINYIQYTSSRYNNPIQLIKESQILSYTINRDNNIINKYTMSTPYGTYTSDDSFASGSIEKFGVYKKDLNFDKSQKVQPTTIAGMQWGAENWVNRGKDKQWLFTCECIDMDFYPNLKETFKCELFDDISFEIISIIENSKTNTTKLVGRSI